MLEDIIAPRNLVYIAGGFYVLGYLILNQIALRLMVLAGTSIYLVYYATVADTPLWEAIYISMMIGIANCIGLFGLLARQSKMVLPAAHLDIYDAFPELPPGDFRRLMKLGRRRKVTTTTLLTQQDRPSAALHYVISGKVHMQKGTATFELKPGIFVGEIAFMTGRNCSATTWVDPEAELITWNTNDLHRLANRNARFKLALEAAISIDLAAKVAAAAAPHTTSAMQQHIDQVQAQPASSSCP